MMMSWKYQIFGLNIATQKDRIWFSKYFILACMHPSKTQFQWPTECATENLFKRAYPYLNSPLPPNTTWRGKSECLAPL